MSLVGMVDARIVDVRFSASGRVLRVNKYAGDTIHKGELVASLDRKILQTQLDRQLADYEKTRADFEIFAAKYPDPKDQMEKYLKAEKQAVLNASVKDVEISKALLDACDLYSPVDGIVLEDSSMIPGINVTPAGGSFKIIDSSSYHLKVEIEQKDLGSFINPRQVKITIEGIEGEHAGCTSLPFSDGKKLFVKIPIAGASRFLLGMVGTVE
jgi:multidrug resistance efflux pump